MNNKEFRFEQGDTLQDLITGFQGIVTGRCDYITGCDQYLLQPKGTKKDTKPDPVWYDDNRLKKVKAKQIVLPTVTEKTGPDMAAPIK
jgi:hypothetical protein